MVRWKRSHWSAVSSSPLQKTRASFKPKADGSSRNMDSMDGTKCNVVISYVLIRLTSCTGSRCAPGGDTTSEPPLINARKNSQTDTSKLDGVFCRMRSSGVKL